MNQNHNHQHRNASEDFQKALDQLESILQENLTQEEIKSHLPSDITTDEELMNLEAFEDAVADIEEYLEEKTKK